MTEEQTAPPQKLRRKATVHDVARLAGVSIATVSRSLNKPETVRPGLRKRVNMAVAELGYYTNSIGKALRNQRSRLIGTIIPKLFDPLFSLVASGVQEALVEYDYLGIIQVAGYDNRDLMKHALPMIEKGAEGLIIFGQVQDKVLLDYCRKRDIPLLSIYSFAEDAPVPCIGFDNYQATTELLNLIVQLGHVEIAMISGRQPGNDRQQARVSSYVATMERLRREPVIEEVDYEFGIQDGAAAFRRIIKRRPEITAVICNRDAHAFSVMTECRRLGLTLPHDMSIAGFDDLAYSSFLDPPLTSVSVSGYEIGRRSGIAMLRHIEEGMPLRSIRLETRIVVRDSTVRPNLNRPLLD